MRTHPCCWTVRISAFFDGEGSAWERWRCGRHVRHCGRCRAWLRQVESGWHRLRGSLRGPAEEPFIAAVMAGVRVTPMPLPARPAAPWRATLRVAAAGSMVAASAALLFPALAARREALLAQSCQGNLQQIGTAMAVYAEDNDDRLPPAGAWTAVATAYSRASNLLRCPRDGSPPFRPSYEFAEPLAGLSLSMLRSRPLTPLVYEGGPGFFARRHDQRGNAWFPDGHVRLVTRLDAW
jgi:prepilin-type processing-associated H-X9-DG protein